MALSTLRGSFAERAVLILGLARQGWEVMRFFADQGAYVTACDHAAVSTAPLVRFPDRRRLRFCLGAHHEELLQGQQLLSVAAGIPKELPLVQAAVAAGIPVVNDSLLTFARARAQKVVITGSHGKTTTTTLVCAMLQAAPEPERQVWVGGNIGVPLLHQAAAMHRQDWLVWEGSSFQLELFDSAAHPFGAESRIDAAVLLNLTPNHLDRHPGMAAYAAAKLRVLDALRAKGRLVLNQDDPACQRLLGQRDPAPLPMPEAATCERLLRQGHQHLLAQDIAVIPVSTMQFLARGACLHNGLLHWDGVPIVSVAELRVRGQHNVTNALAACALTGSLGVTRTTMRQVLRAFSGVPHRLEEVACLDGTVWINDSIATSPERAIAGMRSCCPVDGTLILLAGGYDKGLPWQEFAATARSCVQHLILFGQAGPAIAQAVAVKPGTGADVPLEMYVVPALEDAVAMAARKAAPGSTVLLSPGAASFDGYVDFEARGQHFRELVRTLRPD